MALRAILSGMARHSVRAALELQLKRRAEDCAALPCHALDLIERGRVFQWRCVTEFFAEIHGAHDATRHFFASRFWYVADENNFARRKRFAQIARNVLF